jgi:hypothetical protein
VRAVEERAARKAARAAAAAARAAEVRAMAAEARAMAVEERVRVEVPEGDGRKSRLCQRRR